MRLSCRGATNRDPDYEREAAPIYGHDWLHHDKRKRLLQKGPTVLGAQASSPARVPSNQQPLTELVALDAGRRGRLRSQDGGAFLQEPIKHIGHLDAFRF